MLDDFTGPGLRELGYTREGAEISEETFWLDVPGDERGGEAGPPIEVQSMGQVDRVRLEMTKWDDTIMSLIRANVPAGIAGQPYVLPPGTLVFSNAKFFRLLILGSTISTFNSGAGEPRNYPCAIPRAPRELNKGSKFSTQVLEFECHLLPGQTALWNTVTA